MSVYADQGGKDRFEKHFRKSKISYTAIWDRENRIGKSYGIVDAGRLYPVTPTFLIGKDGQVVWQKVGLYHWPKSIKKIDQRIAAMIEDAKK